MHNALPSSSSFSSSSPQGATVRPCMDENVLVNPPQLIKWIAEKRITWAFLTTQLTNALLEMSEEELAAAGDLQVRGGEVCVCVCAVACVVAWLL